MSDLVRDAYQRTVWALVLRGVFALSIGLFILWRPMDSIATFALVIAIWALFNGVVQVVHAFELRAVYDRWWMLLLSGAIGTLFGLAAFYYYPGLSLTFAVVWFTWLLILTGAVTVLVAVAERNLGLSWVWTLALGLLSIVGGIVGLMSPPATLAAIISLIAIFAIMNGVVMLLGGYRLATAGAAIGDALRGAAMR